MNATQRAETVVVVHASPETAFAWLDDHRRMSGHMEERSWRMGGGRMRVVLDERQGRGVGASICIAGRVFGIPVRVDEVVTLYNPPFRKTWETRGTPRLIVIGHYRMGFEVTPMGGDSRLQMFIDYQPVSGARRTWLRPFARWYAAWCVRSMARDAVTHLHQEAA